LKTNKQRKFSFQNILQPSRNKWCSQIVLPLLVNLLFISQKSNLVLDRTIINLWRPKKNNYFKDKGSMWIKKARLKVKWRWTFGVREKKTKTFFYFVPLFYFYLYKTVSNNLSLFIDKQSWIRWLRHRIILMFKDSEIADQLFIKMRWKTQ